MRDWQFPPIPEFAESDQHTPTIGTCRITFSYKPHQQPELWAQVAGGQTEARRLALRLLAELQVNYPKAAVYIDGQRIQAGQPGSQAGQQCLFDLPANH